MDCIKCKSPIYHPSPNKLCPKCESQRLDEYIAKQEAAQHALHLTRAGDGEKTDELQPPAQVS